MNVDPPAVAGCISHRDHSQGYFVTSPKGRREMSAFYVTGDKKKTFCIYDVPSPEAIRKAAQRNNLPVDSITPVTVSDPYFYR